MRNILIIGASSGIGKASAELLQKDYTVFGTYKDHEVGSEQINYQYLDVLEEDINLQDLPDELHGLVYCPGTINLKPFRGLKPNSFVEDYKLQVIGLVKVIQAVLPKLKNANNSSIVLFSTVAVGTGFSFHSQVSASKGAIEGLTRALAAEFSPGIRVNAIAPSITETGLAARLLSSETKIEANKERHPLKRIGQPEDIAALVDYLVSDKSRWMSGQILHLDGGISNLKV